LEIPRTVENITGYFGEFLERRFIVRRSVGIRPQREYEQWLKQTQIDTEFQKEMEWLVDEVVCSKYAVDSLSTAAEKDPTLKTVVLNPEILAALGEYHYGTLSRELEINPEDIEAIIHGTFDLKEHFLALDRQYVRDVVGTRDPSSPLENLDFAAARILAREIVEPYSALQKELGFIDSLETAPIGTREKTNQAYEKKLAWSQDKPRAYICSPLGAADHAGIHQNMLAARKYCEVAERNMLVVGKAPHAWLPAFLDDHNPVERQIGLDVGVGMLRSADCCLVCGDRISAGMRNEIELAGQMDITIYTFDDKTKTAITDIIGENKKHTHISPFVTSEVNLLGKSPEAINGMRLDKRELRTVDVTTSKTMLRAFQRRFESDLGILSHYEGYRQSRDGRGDTIRMYEEQMQGVENKILTISEQAGMTKEDAQALLKASLDNPKKIKEITNQQEEKLSQDQTQEKTRGR